MHRIGRTARANAGGIAVTLVSPADRGKFSRIESFLKKEIRKAPLPDHLGGVPACDGKSSASAPSGDSRPEKSTPKGTRHGGNRRKPSAPQTAQEPAAAAPESAPQQSAKPAKKRRYYHRKPRPKA